ncbi:DUF4440 domain-containing protein [Metabacillus litoralis]|uniref:nuclear transport factor 2 family protein n=1 Tax=Metabacillus litoralis TaxID=152268 RepID=UPI001CFF4A9C|nr:DUF4440 domain-containing protein [Metabacillus litoralis]
MGNKIELREHLFQLEKNLLKPEIRTSQNELANILADQFFEFGSSGKVLYKDGNIGEEGIGIVNMKLSDFEIHPLSDEIVLATYRVFNEDTKQHSLRSSIWKSINDKWQMVFHQGTKTNSPFSS